MMAETLLQTTVVGSYPQPDWLVDRQMLSKGVPRTRVKDLWRVSEPWLEQAQDDATLLAIRDMERAGIDVITDGEMRRESYSNRFATALEGIDDENPAEIVNRNGSRTPVPRVVGKIRRTGPVELRDMQFLRANTGRLAKITLPGPFTMGQQVKDEFYKDAEAMCMDYAAAVNEEAHDLVKAGAEVYLKQGDTLHSKFMVVDGLYSSVGSYNYHPRSQRYEGEMTINSLDTQSASQLTSAFEKDIAIARHITAPEQIVIPQNTFTVLAARYFFDQL